MAFLAPELTDCREARDWKRWNRRPGFLLPSCLCCGSEPACTSGTRTCSGSTTLPTTIFFTFTNSGLCSGLDGQTFTLTWDGTSKWVYTFTDANGCNWGLIFNCLISHYRAVLTADGSLVYNNTSGTALGVCSPLNITVPVHYFSGSGCATCSTSATWTITVTE